MKIAQVAPLFERVPPIAYGGTERVISCLTEELIRQGHEVTLFATGDSITKARLVSVTNHAMRPQQSGQPWLAYNAMQMDMICSQASDFDMIHFHTDYLHFPITRCLGVPHITTLHGRLDLPELKPLYSHFNKVPVVSISDSQRTPLPAANWQGTVYHGLPPLCTHIAKEPGNYFVFIGRISREKRVDRAIEIAKKCNTSLYIGAKIDEMDEDYFNDHIQPLLNDPLIIFLGEINEIEKSRLLNRAKALLFPIDWPEPFGLVMIEAFSCGTPVIAYRNGAVPEIMEEGVTGYVVNNQDDAIRATQNLDAFDRSGCRAVFDQRFTVTQMANSYLSIYQKVIKTHGR
jgi:glycosyltransferase involved in cell wall biosynthesis